MENKGDEMTGMSGADRHRYPVVDANTIGYYEEHATEVVAETMGWSTESLMEPFLELVPDGGRVLDWGCGSGRDSLTLTERGYRVTSTDASEAMCKAARKLLGHDADIRCETFAELCEVGTYDGIWACASLLHVKPNEMSAVLACAREALVAGGVLFCSFKQGANLGYRRGRWFTDMSEEGLREVLDGASFDVERIWESSDERGRRLGVSWVSAIARKPKRSPEDGDSPSD